ncbi:MAG: hypothetical protein GY928_24740 [Colwellia sp.]|nr:hypothetical protein [Colwellia sp.]
MSRSFCFINKKTGEMDRGADIDDQMCADFDIEPHDSRYYEMWWDIFGLGAIVGKTILETGNEFDDYPPLQRVAKWLDERYTTKAWWSH